MALSKAELSSNANVLMYSVNLCYLANLSEPHFPVSKTEGIMPASERHDSHDTAYKQAFVNHSQDLAQDKHLLKMC